MSDSKSKKKQKKQDKEQIEAFKKAFKKQTGVESDSKDWGKLVGAVQTQLRELAKWTAILVKVQPEELQAGQQRLKTWDTRAKGLQDRSKQDMRGAGEAARDVVLPTLLSTVEAVRKKAKSKPIKQTSKDGREVSVYMTDIPGFADMKTDERQKAIEAAAEKTSRGLSLYEDIANGKLNVDDPTYVTDPDDAQAMVWGLKSKAQEKNGGPYQKGAMTVPNGENLRKFFDKCPQVYSRLSSHLREQQGRNIKGGVGLNSTEGQTPRGMDFYNEGGDDKPGGLPAGMNALLFQQVQLPNGGKALYVKMETEGSFGHPGDNRKMDSTVPPDRAKHPNDGARARKHLKNLIIKQKEGEDKDLPGLREQTPKDVVEAAKAAVSAVEGKKAKAYLKSSFGTEPKWLVFKKAVPRISIFLDAVDDVRKHDGEQGWETGDAADDLLDKFTDVLIAKIPADLLESDRRMGEEVVVTDDDMAPGGTVDVGGDFEEDVSEDDDPPSRPQASVWCSDFVETVLDPALKRQLEDIYNNKILTTQDTESFQNFSDVIGNATPELLGPKASKIKDKLVRDLERL